MEGLYEAIGRFLQPHQIFIFFQGKKGQLSSIALTFGLVLVAWVFFRAESVGHAFGYLHQMVAGPFLSAPSGHRGFAAPLGLSLLLLGTEWIQRERQHALEVQELAPIMRWAAYITVGLLILTFGEFGAVDFIYFQF